MVRRKTAEASLVGKTSLRVRFSEVDSMQIVWHGEYVRYFDTEAAKICFEYTIRSATDGEIVAEGSSTQVFLDARGELQLLAPEFYRKWKERWDVK